MNGRYESFTVRVWAQGDEIVRGEVMHVHSGESERFAELDVLADFLAKQVANGDGVSSTARLNADGRSIGVAGEALERQEEGDTTRAEADQRAQLR